MKKKVPEHVILQRLVNVPSNCAPPAWIPAVQPLIYFPSQIQEELELKQEEIELSPEETKDVLSSLEDLENHRYEVLSSELSNEEFLQAVRKWQA